MSYWADKRVLVTGGTGFLGITLGEQLRNAGAHAISLSRSHPIPDRYSTYNDYVFADLTRIDSLTAVREAEPDVIIHAAASAGGIGYNRDKRTTIYLDNILMADTIANYCRHFDVPMVFVSSVCAYPDKVSYPTTEDELFNGLPTDSNRPYGLAKRDAIELFYGVNVAYMLMANMYGCWDSFDLRNCHVVPALLQKIYDAKNSGMKSIEVWGSQEGFRTHQSTRDLLHVNDAATGILTVAPKLFSLSDSLFPVNIATGTEVSIYRLVTLLCEYLDAHVDITFDSSQPTGQNRRVYSLERANAFGYKPSITIEQGLKDLVSWFCNRKLMGLPV